MIQIIPDPKLACSFNRSDFGKALSARKLTFPGTADIQANAQCADICMY